MRNYSSIATSKVLDALINSTTTSMTVNNTIGLPAAPFTLVIEPDTANEEIVLVIGVAGNTLTIVRGNNEDNGVKGGDGTLGKEHAAGAVVRHMITARDLQEPQDHMAATTNVHGVGSGVAVVGTSTIQTLTNKTLNGFTATGTVTLPSTTSIGTVSSTEIGYLDGVTSAIQTQINAKANTAGPTFTGTVVLPSTTSIGSVDSTELGHLNGVTSAIQTQLDGKQATLPSQTGNSGKYLTTNGSALSWGSVTSSVKYQKGTGTVSVGSNTTLFYTGTISLSGFSSAPAVMIIPTNSTSATGTEYFISSVTTSEASIGVKSSGGSITFSYSWVAIGE